MELQLRAPLTDMLAFAASYMFSRERSPSTGAQLPNRPRHSGKVSVNLGAPAGAWGADLALKYVGSTFSATADGDKPYGDHLVANLGARWFPDSGQKHRIGVRVENIFNKRYATQVRATALSGGEPGEYLVYGNRGTPRTLYANYTFSF
jgi:vitamin B12 transporter